MDFLAAVNEIGFSHVVEFDPKILKARDAVRAMCAEDRCRAYGKNWSCPPNCGTVEECQAKMLSYNKGILLQTTGNLKSVIDVLGYKNVGDRHNELVYKLHDILLDGDAEFLLLGAGGCRRCKKCAYPNPCRMPGKSVSSMEGYGLLVSQVCKDAGAEYNYGEKTITYSACILYNDK